eukprot:jgi/Galph1/5325/GphlegSOOS_G3966.1
MKAVVLAFTLLVLCSIAAQASPLEEGLASLMRGGYGVSSPSQAPSPSCCKLSCQYTQICEQVQQVVQTQVVVETVQQTQQVYQTQQQQTQQVYQSSQVSSSSAYRMNEAVRGGYASQSAAPAPSPSCVTVPVKCCIDCSKCYQQVSSQQAPVQQAPSQQSAY